MLKRILSLGLALFMSAGLMCAPAFAVQADDPFGDDSIAPLSWLYPQTSISSSVGYRTTDFTASSANGNYIRFWFKNTTGEKVKVYLCRTDSGRDVLVESMTVEGNAPNWQTYYSPTAGTGTYYVSIEAIASGGTISGELAVAQYALASPNKAARNRSGKHLSKAGRPVSFAETAPRKH